VEKSVDPLDAELEALASIDLDISRDYFEENVGVAKTSIDPCATLSCEGIPAGTLQLVTHEGEYATIRALFDNDRLAFYTVTATDEDLAFEMKWLGHELGILGRVSFADALGAASLDEPTDGEVRLGAQSSAYAEVLAAGPMADYRGLYLAFAPFGFTGGEATFDLETARSLLESEGEDGVPDPSVMAKFRSASTPNTFGQFRDDGPVAQFVQDHLTDVLYLGTDKF